MKNTFLSLITFISFTVNCLAQQDLVNLAYGKDKQQTLDLFLPKTFTEKTPVVIMIHGGAWMMGGKDYTDKRSKDLRDRGFVVANIDYRYVSETVHCKDLLKDVDNAVAYVLTQGKKYGYSTTQFHLAGISAGAHLSLLYGYTTQRKVRSISALCAPSKFDDAETQAHLQKLQLQKNVELLADATYPASGKISPAFSEISAYPHIKKIPTLLAHGTADDLVDYNQSVNLYAALQKKKVDSKLLTMKGKGHDVGLNEPDSEKEVYDAITNWINSHN